MRGSWLVGRIFGKIILQQLEALASLAKSALVVSSGFQGGVLVEVSRPEFMDFS